MPDNLYIIDGHSLLYQFHYAIRNLTTPRGEAIGATYGMTGLFLKFLDEKVGRLAVCFDPKGKVFRHDIYPDYKANRAPMPDELSHQFTYLKDIVEGLGIRWINVAGFEADDVIGTLARQATEKGIDTVIVTRDKDAAQLLSPHVRIYDNRKDEYQTVASYTKEAGIRPDQVVEMFGLAGDTSDNIPGIPGIGPKGATEMIKKYGDLESVLKHADEFTGAKKEKLVEFADQARLSKKLAVIDTHVKLDFTLDDLKPGKRDVAKLRDLFQKLGFAKYLAKVEDSAGVLELFADDQHAAAKPSDKKEPETKKTDSGAKYELVVTEERLDEVMAELKAAKRFAVDTETTGVDPLRCELVGVSLCCKAGHAWYVPVRAPKGQNHLKPEVALKRLKPILEDEKLEKVGHNIKFDMLVLGHAGVDVRGVTFDTMVASYLLEPGERHHSLDEVSSRRLHHRMTQLTDLIGTGKKQITMDQVDVARVCEYSGDNAEVTWRLHEVLGPELKTNLLLPLFEKIEMPLVEVLRRMEEVGITVDVKLLAKLSVEMQKQIEELTGEIHELAGKAFNIDSPKQLAKVLFEDLHLPVQRKTKTGASTDQEVLEGLAHIHPLPKLIVEHRTLTKLKSTYVDVLPKMVNPDTGRVHTSFNQTVTATGRLSSSDPNLQNIPVRSDLGGQIRRAFVACDDRHVLLSADYSQVELRILAHLSGDKALRRYFHDSKDIHTETAARIYGVEPKEVTSAMRSSAKAVNFGIIYGLSPYGLGHQLGIPQGEAAKIIDGYYDTHPGVEKYFTGVLEDAKRNGFVVTMSGRRRYVDGIKNPQSRSRNQAERVAVNTVIQGSAADLIKIAMLNIHQLIVAGKLEAVLLLQIHDELLYEVAKSDVEHVGRVVKREMEGALKLEVPAEVHLGSAHNWMDVK